jgi:hypothetical protein
MLGGVVRQPTPHDLLLGRREFGRSPRHGPRRQANDPLRAETSQPAADAAGIDAEEVGDLLAGVSLAEALNGQKPPTLQFSR